MCLITDHLWCINEVTWFPNVPLISIYVIDIQAFSYSVMCFTATYGQTIFFFGLGSSSMPRGSSQNHDAMQLQFLLSHFDC